MVKSPKSQIQTISGIVFNAVNRVFEIKRSDIHLLKKYNASWSLLVNKKTILTKKRAIIIKRVREVCVILRAALKHVPTIEEKLNKWRPKN